MRRMIRAVLAAAAAGSILTAAAQDADLQYKLQIARTPIIQALTEFSQQTGLYVSYVVKPQSSSNALVGPLLGRYTAESALEQLTAGTGLTFQRVDATTVAIVAKQVPPIKLARLDAAQPAVLPGRKVAAQPEARPSQDKNLEEVIVTAQRREELLQDVPISISVLSGDALDRSSAEGITDALRQVPGVVATVGVMGGGTLLAVRGVGASGPLFNGSSPVGYYLDSVPFGLVKTAVAPDSNAYDLARVEVLRGPQGTLYGASSSGGVVRVLTRDADPEIVELKVRTSLSTTENGDESYRGDMAVNVPLIDGKLAARAVAGYEKLGGWIDRPFEKDANDAIRRNMRLKLNANPNEKLSFGVSAWVSRDDEGATSTGDEHGRNGSLIHEHMFTDYDVYGLKVGYDFSSFSIASMTSYIDYENGGDLDVFLPVPLFTGLKSEVFSQEVTLNSADSGVWRWSAGLFYRDAKDRLRQTLPGFFPAPIDYTDTSESVAVFGQVGRTFLEDKMELAIGLRYFEDDVTNKENIQSNADPTVPLYRADRSFNSTTPRVVLTWTPHDDVSVYASFSQGFRSGFPQNANIIQQAPEYPSLRPDELSNYELGAKGTLAEGLLSFDTAVYYIDWRDVQQTLTLTFGGTQVTAPVNGQSASGIGVDLAATLHPVNQFDLGLNLSWNDLSLDENVSNDAGVRLFDKGDRLNFSPEYTVGAFANYDFALGSRGFRGLFSVSGNYSSEQVSRTIVADVLQVLAGDSLLLTRTSLAISSPDRWTATLFVDNVNNERGGPPPIDVVTDWVPRVRPRTMGLQLDYRF